MTIAVISMIREPWGGSEELWASMAEEALKHHHTVLHLSYDCGEIHPKTQRIIDKGLICYSRPSYKKRSNNPIIEFWDKGINFLKKNWNTSFEKILKKTPDIILYNGTCYSIGEEKKLLNLLKKTTADFYILGHLNSETEPDLTPSLKKYVKESYARSRKVFFVSGRNLEIAKRQLETDIPNAVIIRNPVNISSTDKIPYPKETTIQFAMVGNLRIIQKGQDIAFETLSTDVWKKRDWHLNIYGLGEDENYLKALAISYKMEDRITFHGRVNDIRNVWVKNHILLMPSYFEGMPLAIVEAMLCGRTCVATDVGGITEWVEENKSGFIAEFPTTKLFSAALEKAWNQKDQWEALGIRSHERAMNLYDSHAGKTLLDLLTNNIK